VVVGVEKDAVEREEDQDLRRGKEGRDATGRDSLLRLEITATTEREIYWSALRS